MAEGFIRVDAASALEELERIQALIRRMDALTQRSECEERARARALAEEVAWYPERATCPATCSVGGEQVFYMAANEAYVPGHVYSPAGSHEFHITGMCEWHFDYWALDLEEETHDLPIWA